MTREQIEEAQRLIAGMRADLALIGGTTDADKLIAIIREKQEGLDESLRKLVWIHPDLNDFKLGSTSDADRVMMMGFALRAVAEMAERHGDHKAKLVEKVAKIVSSIERHLKALREKAGV